MCENALTVSAIRYRACWSGLISAQALEHIGHLNKQFFIYLLVHKRSVRRSTTRTNVAEYFSTLLKCSDQSPSALLLYIQCSTTDKFSISFTMFTDLPTDGDAIE